MVGLRFAAVPLDRLFCQVTGHGGTTQIGTTAHGALRRQCRGGHAVDIRRSNPVERGLGACCFAEQLAKPGGEGLGEEKEFSVTFYVEPAWKIIVNSGPLQRSRFPTRNRGLAGDLRVTGKPTFVVGDQIICGPVDLQTLQQSIADAREEPRR